MRVSCQKTSVMCEVVYRKDDQVAERKGAFTYRSHGYCRLMVLSWTSDDAFNDVAGDCGSSDRECEQKAHTSLL